MSFDQPFGKRARSFVSRILTGESQEIYWNGQPYAGHVEPLSERALGDLPQGPWNAANADRRRVSMPGIAFSLGSLPAEEQMVSFDEGHGLTAYTIVSAPVDVVAGVLVNVNLIVYRVPIAAASLGQTVAEGSPGSVPDYVPPSNPY